MGKPKYVYLQDEVFDLLKKVDNASYLINKLVKEHFKYEVGNPQDKELLISQEMEKHQTKIQELEMQRQKALEDLDKKKEEELLKQQKQEEKEEKERQKIRNIKLTFYEEMEREMTEAELKEYLNGSFHTVWEFCDSVKNRNI